jgi:hypothetical protein
MLTCAIPKPAGELAAQGIVKEKYSNCPTVFSGMGGMQELKFAFSQINLATRSISSRLLLIKLED